MAALSLHVKACAAWIAGRGGEDVVDSLIWTGDGWGPPERLGEGVPMSLRRRVSKLGQQVLKAAWEMADTRQSRLIFASRHGEFGRILSIMESLTRQTEVSPADFTLSVHHALVGLLSIATDNKRGHTAVAAGPESFANAMLEAAVCLVDAPEEPVIVGYYDEPLPAPYSDFTGPAEDHLALVLSLSSHEGMALRLSSSPRQAGDGVTPHPAEAVLDFLRGDRPRLSVHGERLSWVWEKTDVAA